MCEWQTIASERLQHNGLNDQLELNTTINTILCENTEMRRSNTDNEDDEDDDDVDNGDEDDHSSSNNNTHNKLLVH